MANALDALLLVTLVLAGQFLGLLAHELGHAVAGWICGWKPLVLKVGRGAVCASFRVGDLEFRWTAIPATGFVQVYSVNPTLFRLKDLVISMGGPLATGGVLWMLACAYRALPETAPGWLTNGVGFLAMLQMLLLVYSLFPQWVTVDGRRVANDMLLIWQTLTLKRQEVPRRIFDCAYWAADCFLGRGQMERAQSVVETAVLGREKTARLKARMTWIYYLQTRGKDQEARAVRAALIKESNDMDRPRTQVLDSLACFPMYYDYPELLEEGLEVVNLALEEAPADMPLKATKGALLVELHQLDEGQRLLDEVSRCEATETDQALCHYYGALAVLKGGDRTKAVELLQEAIRKFPEFIVKGRIEQMFSKEVHHRQ